MLSKKFCLLVSSAFFLASCGENKVLKSASSGTGSVAFGQSMESQFIDAPVKGLSFKTESGVESKTGDAGKFNCMRGEKVEFFFAGLNLGASSCGAKIFVHDLISNQAGYSIDKAAAVIQSFAPSISGVLDLTLIDESALDLSNQSYNSLNLTATHNAAVYLAGTAKPAIVSPANALIAANAALAEHTQLDRTYKNVLSQLAQKVFIPLKLKLKKGTMIAGYGEYCWQEYRAEAKVTASNDIYKMEFNSAVGYDSESVLINGCSAQEAAADACENSTNLPRPKIIDGMSLNLMNSYSYTETINSQSFLIDQRDVASLDITVGGNKVIFSGHFDRKASHSIPATPEINCQYEISGEEFVVTEEAQEEEPVSAVNYSTSMIECNEGLFNYNLSASVTGNTVLLTVENTALSALTLNWQEDDKGDYSWQGRLFSQTVNITDGNAFNFLGNEVEVMHAPSAPDLLVWIYDQNGESCFAYLE